MTGEFPAQMASNAENVSIWWRNHERNGYESTELLLPRVTLPMTLILDFQGCIWKIALCEELLQI